MHEPTPLPRDIWSGPPAARLRDLPKSERAVFAHWLRGQTIPSLDGVPSHEQDAYYLHDYRRWRDAASARADNAG
jgi:hypothetical protein